MFRGGLRELKTRFDDPDGVGDGSGGDTCEIKRRKGEGGQQKRKDSSPGRGNACARGLNGKEETNQQKQPRSNAPNSLHDHR